MTDNDDNKYSINTGITTITSISELSRKHKNRNKTKNKCKTPKGNKYTSSKTPRLRNSKKSKSFKPKPKTPKLSSQSSNKSPFRTKNKTKNKSKTAKLSSSMSFNHKYDHNDNDNNHSQRQKKSRSRHHSRNDHKYKKNKTNPSSLKPSPITTKYDKYKKSTRPRDLSPARSIASSSSSLSDSDDDDELTQTMMRISLHNNHSHNIHTNGAYKLHKKRTVSPRSRRGKKSTNSSTSTSTTTKPPLTPTSRHPHSPQNSWYFNCPTHKKQALTPKADDNNNNNGSAHGHHSNSLIYKLSEMLNIKKEDRHLSTWSKMEIAEWLQINWYTTQSNHNRSKLLTYINKIKREKKFNGENIYKLNDRGLKVLAQRHLGLRKGESDYKIFINRIRELQSKYASNSSPRRMTNHSQYKSDEYGLSVARQRSHTFTRTELATEDEKEGANNKHCKNKNVQRSSQNASTVHHRLNRAKSHKMSKTETENDPLSLQQKQQSEEFLRKKSLSFNTFSDHSKIKLNRNNNKKRTRSPKKRKRDKDRSRLKQMATNKIKRALLSSKNKEKPLKLTIHDEKSNKVNKAKRNRNRQKTWNIMDINHQHKLQQNQQNHKYQSTTPDRYKKKDRNRKKRNHDNVSDSPSLEHSFSHNTKPKKKYKQKLPKFKFAKSNVGQKSTTPTPKATRKRRKEKATKLTNIKDAKSKSSGNGLRIRFESKSPHRKYSNGNKKKKRPTSAKASNLANDMNVVNNLEIISSTKKRRNRNGNGNGNRVSSPQRKNIRDGNDRVKRIKMRTKRIRKTSKNKPRSSTPKASRAHINTSRSGAGSKRKRSRNKRSISTISPKKGTKENKNKKRARGGKYSTEINNDIPNNGAPPASAKSCPPTSIDNQNGCKQYDGYDDLGLVILETGDSNHNHGKNSKHDNRLSIGRGHGLQFSVTSPASSPSPHGHKHIHNHNLNMKYHPPHGHGHNIRYSKYEGVTADELLQLISYGHADEIDTDYDTDTNTNDIYTYINHNDYNEYISETPSPKEHLHLDVDDDDAFPTIYNVHRLQLVGSNSANYSNISNISTSISSLQSSQCTLTDNELSGHSHNKGAMLNNNKSPHGLHFVGSSGYYRPKHFRFSDHSDDTEVYSDHDENLHVMNMNNLTSPRLHKVKSRGHNKSLTDGFQVDKHKKISTRDVTKLQTNKSADSYDTTLTNGTSSDSANTNGTSSSSIHIKDIPLFDNITSGAVSNKHTTMVIPSIFAIDDTDTGNGDDIFPPKIALSPIISSDTLKTSGDGGLLLNMMCYSMTDESTDEEDDKYVSHRNSTVKMALQTTKRVMQYALHNSPDTTPLQQPNDNNNTETTDTNLMDSPFGDIDLSLMNNDNDNDDNDLPNSIPTVPKLTSSKTGLAVLDDIADFVNDSDGTQ